MSSTPASASISGSSVVPGFPKMWRTPSVRSTSSNASRPLSAMRPTYLQQLLRQRGHRAERRDEEDGVARRAAVEPGGERLGQEEAEDGGSQQQQGQPQLVQTELADEAQRDERHHGADDEDERERGARDRTGLVGVHDRGRRSADGGD